VLRGAEVTLTNEGTSAKLTTTAGPDGTYKFTPVRIGTYSLTAISQGFQTTTQHGVTVNVAASVVVHFKLKPGLVSETVEVASAPSGLETQDASVGQVINSRNVNNLPLNGRNFTFLARFVAGVNSPQADFRGNAASGAFAANGLRPAQNNYLLDGIDNNSDTVDFLNGTNFVVLPPVDAIQEFKIQTTGFSAEFGRSGAAVLNATIKSGTNNFHGALWSFSGTTSSALASVGNPALRKSAGESFDLASGCLRIFSVASAWSSLRESVLINILIGLANCNGCTDFNRVLTWL